MDAFCLKKAFESTLKEDTDFQLLCRVIKDQTTTDEDGNNSLKKGKEISSTSLQTPIEPEATYRYKSGQHHKGYIANIVETVDEDSFFITHYSFDANIQSDVHFAYETIDRLGKQEEPTVLVADGAYDSEEARNLGKINGIDLVTTELKGRSPNPGYVGIIIDEEKNTVELPDGLKARSVSYYEETDMYRAVFDKEDCSSGNQDAYGMMKEQKKTKVLMISPKMVHRANQAKHMKSK